MTSSTNKQVSFLKTCINGINALSGIGILSVPYALSSGGWLSLILLLLIATSACFTGLLIRRCLDSNPLITSYPDIAGVAFGKKGRITASIFICLELYLVATGLLILEGDNLHKLSPNFALKLGGFTLDGRHSFVIIAGVMIFPSMWLSDLGVLSYISFGGVVSSLIIVVSIFCVGTSKGVGFHGKGSLVNFKGLPTALSLYTFCYGAHAMFPTIYNSMRKKSQFSTVLLLSFIICTITYVSMAILGYLIYGHTVQSQVTLNLPKEKISSKVAIYTILAGPIAKYALTIMPVASAIESSLPANYQDSRHISILIKMFLLVSTVVFAVLFPSFESVTSLSGAVLIVAVSFLLPCVCYLKIFGVYRNMGYELAGIVGIILLAVLVGVVGTYSSITQTVKQV
ncbi:Vacuolar amino acid transporter like [Actinidia chinensis var. chinensis]|uniref:Vacuolar amino acid transporter like n=1 Tax=Actinidia chinensis var. chinensis TaxID=1590841 RepID=A0A2R6Q8U3_ACTCC|nr:Vacuolar amino acid transporter like [Actinidia chinensis var. chinensis]